MPARPQNYCTFPIPPDGPPILRLRRRGALQLNHKLLAQPRFYRNERVSWTTRSRGLSVEVGQASARLRWRAAWRVIVGPIVVGSGYDEKVAPADRLIGQVVRFALGLGGCDGQT